ncbi:Proteophosphoglycan 5 [Rhodotorula toruloides ATCC 204091]|uniref:Proteophosphoglycan 5 n=2 Tax=Rhodotorula toruloides TaxID=5286 RepID=A0A2S9ZYL3_RHOTO|nr:Proteophosphoglycan 5 [Rhodotorula toruloides ATCC 204091]PRQ70869.1 Proteophosphoglycan 5 [Rhodotorula toruloides]
MSRTSPEPHSVDSPAEQEDGREGRETDPLIQETPTAVLGAAGRAVDEDEDDEEGLPESIIRPPRPDLATGESTLTLTRHSSSSHSSLSLTSDLSDADADPSSSTPHALTDSEWKALRKQRRKLARRMYGGGNGTGRHAHSLSEGFEVEFEEFADEEGGSGECRAAPEEEEDGAGGGGKADKSVGEVAGMVCASASLSPFPLLLPLACSTLSPALFVPLLFFAAVLGWMGAVVIGVEGRYVGARSYPALTSSLLPHRLRLHRLFELFSSLFVLLGSIVRTTLGTVIAAEVAVGVLDVRRSEGEEGRGWRVAGVAVVCAVWFLVPLVLPPLLSVLGLAATFPSFTSSSSRAPNHSRRPSYSHYTRLSTVSTPDLRLTTSGESDMPGAGSSGPSERPRWTALLTLPPWSIALLTWPIALLILGVRIKHINKNVPQPSANSSALLSIPSLPLFSGRLDDEDAALWPSILLTFASGLSTSHETFFYLTSLRRPSNTAMRHQRRASQAGNIFGAGGGAGAGEGKRNQYPLAIALGLAGAAVLNLGWSLVGSLGFRFAADFLPAANLLSDTRLPRSDASLWFARILVLFSLLSQLEPHAHVGTLRVRRAISYCVPTGGAAGEVSEWRRVIARAVVWGLTALAGAGVVYVPRTWVDRGAEGGGGVGEGEGAAWLAQWSAVIVGGIGGCLLPAIGYLILFHLRRPRLILLTPHLSSQPAHPHEPDSLLQRKEREMQRRLSGRRVWSDVAVFGVMGPVGIVLIGRGVVALVRG